MGHSVRVLRLGSKIQDADASVVSTVAKAGQNWCNLSPFLLGPCKLYGNWSSKNMENGWQYSKVYPQFASRGEPTAQYFAWAKEGWSNSYAVRYPMGKGAVPLYSYWDGEKLKYVEARKRIYVPLYAEAVQKSIAFDSLKRLHEKNDLILLDYDAYNHAAEGMTLTDVLNNPQKKMGHAFVLMMLLTGDKALSQCELR